MPGYPQIFGISTASRVRSLAFATLLTISTSFAQAPVTTPQAAAPVTSSPVTSAPLTEYTIGPGDELVISYPYNAELNHEGLVGPDGRITLPLLGNVALGGDTVNQATAAITNALRDAGIVQNAFPNITIRRYGTNVYVGGQVKAPGIVQLASGMDALQAIIAAGGLTDSAKTGKIAIIRRTADNHSQVLYINVSGYTKGKANATVATLEPRDVVFVPRTKIAEIDMWIDNYINKTLPFSRGINYSYGNYPVTTTSVAK